LGRYEILESETEAESGGDCDGAADPEAESRAARWISADALRELEGEAVQARLRRKER